MSGNQRMLTVRALVAAQAAVLGVMFAGCLASAPPPPTGAMGVPASGDAAVAFAVV